ncbi:MAG: hypothetical protein J0M00_01315 [Burkholderiales bacterium]|jgi:hypothetical protein|nr:hypothetical protein [Burkholderiales bacterium]
MQILRCLSMGVAFGCLPMTILGQQQLVLVTLPRQLPVERQVVAPPRDFVEICTAVEAGRAITWQFEADAPLAFNTHFHVKGDVRAPENMSAVSAAQGRLTPKGNNDYCWLWSNRTTLPVSVRMRFGP